MITNINQKPENRFNIEWRPYGRDPISERDTTQPTLKVTFASIKVNLHYEYLTFGTEVDYLLRAKVDNWFHHDHRLRDWLKENHVKLFLTTKEKYDPNRNEYNIFIITIYGYLTEKQMVDYTLRFK